MGPGTCCFPYQLAQLQAYESRTLFSMTSLQFYCILGLAEIKSLHPRDKIMRKKNAGCTCNKTTALIDIFLATLVRSNLRERGIQLVRAKHAMK